MVRHGAVAGEGQGPVPGVIVLPPVAFLAALAAGVALEFLWPTTFISGFLRVAGGGVLFVGGAGLLALSLREFRRHGTDPDPRRPDACLVCTGVYGHSRNPIYVGMFLLVAGLGAWADSVWIVLLMLPVWAVIRYGVIAREERHLEAVFGEPYRAYCKAVRRWM